MSTSIIPYERSALAAAHIKTSLDAAAINVMRTRKNKKDKTAIQNTQVSPQSPDEETDV